MFVIPDHTVTAAYHLPKVRGIKLRFIAEINKDNIQYCKMVYIIEPVLKLLNYHHLLYLHPVH